MFWAIGENNKQSAFFRLLIIFEIAERTAKIYPLKKGAIRSVQLQVIGN